MSNSIQLPTQLPFLAEQAVRPKIIFFGDPHSKFEPVIRTVLRDRPEAIILLGDIEARQPLQVELASILDLTEIWWIPGNHDTDKDASYDNLWGSTLAHRNLHGRIATIAGYRVAGLGGVFRQTVWDPRLSPMQAQFQSERHLLGHIKRHERWRDGISLRHRSSIFPVDYARLADGRADILVTHEGLGGARYGQPVLNALATRMGVRLAVHGHLHQFIDYRHEGLLPENSTFVAFGVDMDSNLAWSRTPDMPSAWPEDPP